MLFKTHHLMFISSSIFLFWDSTREALHDFIYTDSLCSLSVSSSVKKQDVVASVSLAATLATVVQHLLDIPVLYLASSAME